MKNKEKIKITEIINKELTSLARAVKTMKTKNIIIVLLGTAILAFGLYNVHSLADITEGGILGLTLLLDHHFSISPAVSSIILNMLCYIFAWRILGADFAVYSAVSGIGFSVFYAIFESFPPIFPNIGNHQLIAALIGAVFVGVGVGLEVRIGAASGGDDALAMAISHITPLKLEAVYLISDITVLALSVTYIPISKLIYSLLTVVLSGQIIGLISRVGTKPITKKP